MMHIADNHDALLDYLYEEGDAAERLKIARHLQECASCSVAVLELQTVRGMLSEWRPPVSDLGFRMVQDQQLPLVQRRRLGHLSSWAQAAAALLLFVGGMAVSQLNLDVADGALTVRTRPAAPDGAGIRRASIQLPPEPTPGQSTPIASANDGASTEQLLQRVRAMIEQSEVRQQRELALRLSQVAREVDTQHKADLLGIQQNLGQIEMETGAQQQQIMDYLVRTSGGQK